MADLDIVISRVCEIFKISSLFPEQIEALKVVLDKKSVYASLPTGYGKSIIFYAIPVAFGVIHNQPRGTSIVIIISPLQGDRRTLLLLREHR
jgi:superfamily II DNA helicase RecQ